MPQAKSGTPKEKNVDSYIAGLGGWQAEVVSSLRQIVPATAPDAKESIKRAQPVYEDGGPLCFIEAHNDQVNFGFWRGVNLKDLAGVTFVMIEPVKSS